MMQRPTKPERDRIGEGGAEPEVQGGTSQPRQRSEHRPPLSEPEEGETGAWSSGLPLSSVGHVDVDIRSVQLLDILLDLGELRLVLLLPLDLAHRIELRQVRGGLILSVHLLPLGLQTLNETHALVLGHLSDHRPHSLILLLLQLPDVVILAVYILLDMREVLGNLAVVILVKIVLRTLRDLLRDCQDRLHGIGHDEILGSHEVHHRRLICPRHARFVRVLELGGLGDSGVVLARLRERGHLSILLRLRHVVSRVLAVGARSLAE
mmetsp:Transcript_31422/g.71520  ORF Transcript_31422/g.71520 Transcript_31422/m.71520 type:complete len:265 (+) Transcript_31422:105-899(+)